MTIFDIALMSPWIIGGLMAAGVFLGLIAFVVWLVK